MGGGGVGIGDVMGAIEPIKRIDEAVGIIARLTARLKADPDAAAARLAEALGEVEKSCRALDEALAKFLTLALDRDALDQGSGLLLEIGGGGLIVTVERGRGHCHKIGNIYWEHLDRWFERVFKGDSEEYQSLRQVFDELGNADLDLFRQMVEVAREAQQEANVVLDHLFNDRREEARKAVRASFARLNPVRIAINELLAKLYSLRAQFIQISGV